MRFSLPFYFGQVTDLIHGFEGGGENTRIPGACGDLAIKSTLSFLLIRLVTKAKIYLRSPIKDGELSRRN